MKKLSELIFSFLFAAFILVAVSCHGKKKDMKDNPAVRKFFNNLVFYNMTGVQCLDNADDYYFSDTSRRFAGMVSLEKNKVIFSAEKYDYFRTGHFETMGLYNPVMDDASWIEDSLVAYEERRLARVFEENEEISSPLEGFDFAGGFEENGEYVDLSENVLVENSGIRKEGGENAEEIPEENAVPESVEKRLLDSNARLRMLEFEDEVFVPEAGKDNTVLINKAGTRAVRTFYDSLYRVTEKEIWKIAGARDSSVERYETYSYKGDSFRPHKISVSTKGSTVIQVLNERGLTESSRTEKFVTVKTKDPESGKETEKELSYVSSDIRWTFDEEDRITSENQRIYVYANENYEKAVSIRRKKQSYIYHKDSELPPDYEYYEDGKLRMRTRYTGKETWTTEMKFDEGYSVVSNYTDGKKTLEEYFLDGKKIRSTAHE